MMAADASAAENLVVVVQPTDPIADREQTATPPPHDAESEPDQVTDGGAAGLEEIANKHITSVEDQINSADVSVSGGSDTETSRGDAAAKGKDGGDRVQSRNSSAIRKPATFKAVSVNRTFLAAKANTTSAAARPGDKNGTAAAAAAAASTLPQAVPTGPSALSASRPRLVAKSGGGGRDAAPKFSNLVNGKPAAGPDPSVVWNKNKPIPVPDPRKFTDEELKKYGIHMANRLAPEDLQGQGQGQSNWADLDDDDDDWAPETITWTDGTKIQLPTAETIAAAATTTATAATTAPASNNHAGNNTAAGSAAPEPSAAIPAKAAEPAASVPMPSHAAPVPDPTPPTSLLPAATATTTRPPAPAISPAKTGGGGVAPTPSKGLVVLRSGQVEKPVLVAKPHGPAGPSKSPWAPLPPIDRASPAVRDMMPPPPLPSGPRGDLPAEHQMQHQMQHQQQYQLPHQHHPVPPGQAKEIAVDDFTRPSWRDGSSAAPRELYNFHSGRYEPIPDRRLPPLPPPPRTELLQTRQPALLQRQGPDHAAAEPSQAFQTSRVIQESSYGRRRGSSNVSAGSGPFVTRPGRGPDGPFPSQEPVVGNRRESIAGSIDSPTSSRNISPTSLAQPARQQQQQQQQQQQHPTQQYPAQQWLGRTSPALVNAHLHSHPSHPLAADTTKQETHQSQALPSVLPPALISAPAPIAAPIPDQEIEVIQRKIMREKRELAVKRRNEEEAREETARQERIRLKLAALGPAPDRKSAKKEGAIKDQGTPPMTTDHQQKQHPHVASTGASGDTSTAANKPVAEPVAAQDGRGFGAPIVVETGSGPDMLINGSARPASGPSGQLSNPIEGKRNTPSETPTRPERDRFAAPWGGSSQQASRNVWASPNTDRSLGNGTFNPDLGRVSAAGPSQQQPHQKQPQQPAASSQSGQPGQPDQAQQSGRQSRYVPAPPLGPGLVDARTRWATSVMDNDLALKRAQLAEIARRAAEGDGTVQTPQPAIKDTWRPTHRTIDGGRNAGLEPTPAPEEAAPNATGTSSWEDKKRRLSATQGSTALAQQHTPPGRSRFFPSKDSPSFEAAIPAATIMTTTTTTTSPVVIAGIAHATSPAEIGQAPPVFADRHDDKRSSSPSPPPPTANGHPVYDGDVLHPHVSLPKPHPVVKLPPATPSLVSTSPESRKESPGPITPGHKSNSSHDHRQTQPRFSENWQDKINNLLKPSSPSKPTGVEPVSRANSDQNLGKNPTAVSLPARVTGGTFRTTPAPAPAPADIATKPMAEDCFEEQEMGSLPPIRIPHKAPDAAWDPAPPQLEQLPRKFAVTQPQTREPFFFTADLSAGGHATVRVRVLGMDQARTMVLFSPARGPRGSGFRYRNPNHRGNHGHGKQHRDASGQTTNEPTGQTGPNHPRRNGRGGGGGSRGRQDNWHRQGQAPLPA